MRDFSEVLMKTESCKHVCIMIPFFLNSSWQAYVHIIGNTIICIRLYEQRTAALSAHGSCLHALIKAFCTKKKKKLYEQKDKYTEQYRILCYLPDLVWGGGRSDAVGSKSWEPSQKERHRG